MAEDSLTREQVDELLRFLPLFEVPGRQLIVEWRGGTETASGAITVPYPVYADDVLEFYRLAGQPCWSDYDYEPRTAWQMLHQGDEFIQRAAIEDVKTMLTYCVRGERFCDGHWAAMIESGRVVALLRRLEVLRESMVR